MRRIHLVLLIASVAVPAAVWLSAQLSLDRSFAHTRATEALPTFSSSSREGLVRIPANGFEFRARMAGFDREGPALVLLHGFPSLSAKWKGLIERAATSGYRVVAYDQRGFSPGARPEGVDAYQAVRVAQDVFSVADAVGVDEFHLVGHDWGAMVAWHAAGARPGRVLSLTTLSIPHPAAIRPPGATRSPPTYVRLARQSGVAETLLGFGGRWYLNRVFWPPMSDADRAEYNAAYSEPGALEATLALYRAMDLAKQPYQTIITRPVHHLYGRDDMPVFVGEEVLARLPQWVSGELTVKAYDEGHWLVEEREDEIVGDILRHLETLQ